MNRPDAGPVEALDTSFIRMSQFCAEDTDPRHWLHNPALITGEGINGNGVVATNGHFIVVIDNTAKTKSVEQPTEHCRDSISRMIFRHRPKEFGTRGIVVDVCAIELPAPVNCSICDGTCWVTDYCDSCKRTGDEQCPACGNDGRGLQSICIHDQMFNVEYLRKLQNLPGCLLEITAEDTQWFQFAGGFGAIMPMRRPHDIHHESFSLKPAGDPA